MFTLAISGGIGTGKSTAVRLLEAYHGPACVTFDCDASVHRWLTDPEIVEIIEQRFGSAVLTAQGAIDRDVLGSQVFAKPADREFLESLLHPLVLQEAKERWQEARRSEELIDLFVFEVPLLYEVEFAIPHDLDLLVAASRDIQRERLRQYRRLPVERINSILDSQMAMDLKVERADRVLWNDGSQEELNAQLMLMIQYIHASEA